MKEKIKNTLKNHSYRTIDQPGFTHAAVLIPIFCKKGDNYVVLTKRTDDVRHHKGQISFPGGVQDDPREPLAETAKRETFEEIGVQARHIEILGRLDETLTISGYVVTPFVGLIPHPYPFKLNPLEVQELIMTPLSFIMNAKNVISGPYEYEGMFVETERYEFEGHTIWGATARIIKILRDTLGEDAEDYNECFEE